MSGYGYLNIPSSCMVGNTIFKMELYHVRIAGTEWTYSSAKEVWCSEHVKVRAYVPFEYFVKELNAGFVCESGDVQVWKEPTPPPND